MVNTLLSGPMVYLAPLFSHAEMVHIMFFCCAILGSGNRERTDA